MAAYVIAEVNVTEPKSYEEYRKLVPATLEKHGGRFLVRGGAVETKEGGWAPARIVVLEFSSMAQARNWYHSPEYQQALAIRLKTADSKVIFVEGA
ncbi:MAG: D-fructose-6-phosphate amidotransferase [Betaproteobacteria bacterium RIFCSPLOWO2_02_67_12]|nr:MAG: D-fructose-6-phosphate amidotransferase [Betaproteobacteria bacterium RIFCSPLOWO2_02_67_12]OGA31299.1 MAG: D-fructose-6-phosphate amidotransferase [Betaproteobacteria bacterium RIFCSPLOWO2_02_FULL_68_150]OGA60656.1 MAG: D-fructose-6-phosphate amidotransferase [Betaproteobacteria bacterium RIFCSPLOWO2_12_FULL_67_28]